MRFLSILAVALAVPASVAVAAPPAPAARTAELNALFEALKRAPSADDAEGYEARIFEILSQSTSDTANLLYARGLEAMSDDKDLAVELLTAVTELQPDFAEAWQELGRANFELQAHDAALFDLERALQIEPRHYGALVGIAEIFEMYGNKKAALDALRRAHAINPHLPDIDKRIRALSLEAEGQRI